MQRLTAALTALFVSSVYSNAAEIQPLYVEDDFAQILLQGKIMEGDGAKFYRLAEQYPRASIVLESPGGVVEEALSIGAEIAVRGYATYTGGGNGCFSACALIWVAGARRYMMRDAVIGVHAAYETISGPDGGSETQVSGVGNARIGAYLNEIGLSEKAISFFTLAGPEEVQYLTPALAQRLDIDVYVQDGFETETPADRPTPRRITDTATKLLATSTWCADILSLDANPVKMQGAKILRKGHELFGGETFAELIVEYSDRRKQEVAKMGEPAWCIEAESTLRQSGIQVPSLTGPGFDCEKATTASERTICTTPSLWASDRALTWAYGYYRNRLEPEEFKTVQRNQREWLARRETCGNSVVCARRVYSARLREMGVF